MTGRVIAVGDVHLGAANANADDFDDFLDHLHRERADLDEVILLGDLWDLVRRDPFGCAWETSGTITRLKRLAAAVPVRYVLGNHDACLRGLDDDRYEIDFRDGYVLRQGGYDVRFQHGNAFDRFQFDAVSNYLSGPGDRGEIDPTGGRKDPVVAAAREAIRSGKGRLRAVYGAVAPTGADADADAVDYPRRERRAHAYLETVPEDKLIYGHTHAPYVHPDNVAANPGSWKSTAPVHNTYLVVEDGWIELYRYRGDGVSERIE